MKHCWHCTNSVICNIGCKPAVHCQPLTSINSFLGSMFYGFKLQSCETWSKLWYRKQHKDNLLYDSLRKTVSIHSTNKYHRKEESNFNNSPPPPKMSLFGYRALGWGWNEMSLKSLPFLTILDVMVYTERERTIDRGDKSSCDMRLNFRMLLGLELPQQWLMSAARIIFCSFEQFRGILP